MERFLSAYCPSKDSNVTKAILLLASDPQIPASGSRKLPLSDSWDRFRWNPIVKRTSTARRCACQAIRPRSRSIAAGCPTIRPQGHDAQRLLEAAGILALGVGLPPTCSWSWAASCSSPGARSIVSSLGVDCAPERSTEPPTRNFFGVPSALETFDPRVLFLQPSWPLDFANVQPSVLSYLCYMVARILSAPQ